MWAQAPTDALLLLTRKLEDDDELFYGFWGNCLNAYRDTASHRGCELAPSASHVSAYLMTHHPDARCSYEILRKWKQQLVCKRGDRSAFQRTFQQLRASGALPASVLPDAVSSDPFFVYTSNVRENSSAGGLVVGGAALTHVNAPLCDCAKVDAHFHRGFGKDEVYELHGNVELWQCGGVDASGTARVPCDGIWRADPDFRFHVDAETMRAAGGAVALCRECGGKGRPNVLMFRDRSWIPNVRDEVCAVVWFAYRM